MTRLFIVATIILLCLCGMFAGETSCDVKSMHCMPYAGIRKEDRKIMIGECPAYYSAFYLCVADDTEKCISVTKPIIHWFTPFPKWYDEALDKHYSDLCSKYKTTRAGTIQYILYNR